MSFEKKQKKNMPLGSWLRIEKNKKWDFLFFNTQESPV
jgi:hypothetical protein